MVKMEKYEIFNSGTSGRGIRSTLHVKSGEEILKETPLVKTLTNAKYRGVRCDFCFSDAEKLFKCSKCKFVLYCGKNCQSGDWEVHKHECKCLVKVSPKQPPDICRLVSHLLFKYYTKSKKSPATGDADTSEIEKLIDNRDFISSARKEAFFTFSGVLYDYLQGCSFTDDADIYGLLCRISCNSFTITNSELNSLGKKLMYLLVIAKIVCCCCWCWWCYCCCSQCFQCCFLWCGCFLFFCCCCLLVFVASFAC